MNWEKPDEKFCNQWRSWEIMREYFGIQQPGTYVSGPIRLPDDLQNKLEKAMKEVGPLLERKKRELIACN